MSDVVVIGGGITGLAAARDLLVSGASVTLVEPDHVGGKLRTTPFDGSVLDEAGSAELAAVPDRTAPFGLKPRGCVGARARQRGAWEVTTTDFTTPGPVRATASRWRVAASLAVSMCW